MLVSKKTSAALIDLEPVELEVLGQPPAKPAQPGKQLLRARSFFHFERTHAHSVQGHVVAFAKTQSFDDGGGQPDRQAVTPLGYLHGSFLDIRMSLSISRRSVLGRDRYLATFTQFC